jgi:hypothetical protein
VTGLAAGVAFVDHRTSENSGMMHAALPVTQPTNSMFISVKTAKALGRLIPNMLLVAADEMTE